MKASIILAHPYEKSFNRAIFDRAVQAFQNLGIEPWKHDLYKEDFNPVMTRDELGKLPSTDTKVLLCTQELIDSDFLVFIHPDWWGQPPAILKGYIDRVIRPPHAYDYDENAEGSPATGKLGGKTGIVFTTANTDAERETAYFGDPLEKIWTRCVFGFCGIENSRHVMFSVVSTSSQAQREAWLEQVQDVIETAVAEKRCLATDSRSAVS